MTNCDTQWLDVMSYHITVTSQSHCHKQWNFSVYRTMDECDKWRSVWYGLLSHEAKPSVIRAHITHFFTYHTSPRVIYSLYHNSCPICLLFVEVLPNTSIKPWKTHEIKTWKIMKYFCSVISYFGKTYHTLPQCDLDS